MWNFFMSCHKNPFKLCFSQSAYYNVALGVKKKNNNNNNNKIKISKIQQNHKQTQPPE